MRGSLEGGTEFLDPTAIYRVSERFSKDPNQEDWEAMVQAHSRPLFPGNVWNQKWLVRGQSFVPLIRAYDQYLGYG